MPLQQLTRVITPAASLWLVTLAQAKDALGIAASDNSQDGQVGQHVAQMSHAINNYCDRVFAVQTYRDQIRFPRTDQPLITRQRPIVLEDGVPLIAVTEDGAVVDPASFEVYPDNGSLFRLDNSGLMICWSGAVTVLDYTAGFDPIPPDVQGACLEWLAVRWVAVGRDPSLRSETVPDLITQVYGGGSGGDVSIPAGVRDWLTPYRLTWVI